MGGCNAGFFNCNNIQTDGCEINVTTDINNCGACGTVCNFANATPACTMGFCSIGLCNGSFANCNGNPADGCETNLNISINNCGQCGLTCIVANGTSVCTAGVCGIGACNAGFANCNGINSDGCEINLMVTVSNCGTCGHACSFINATAVSCSAGICSIISCNSGFANCNGIASDGCELNTTNSPTNCGFCGFTCPAGHSCINSVCN
jgi:hypothetical protein